LEVKQQALVIARKEGDRTGESGVLNSIGSEYFRLGQNPKALEFFQQALAITQELSKQELGLLDHEANILSNIGFVLAEKQPELAIIFFKQSVNVQENIRQDLKPLSVEEKTIYTKTVEGTYQRLADLLLKQDRILEAQQVLDLLKVQELDDYLRNVRGNNQTARGLDSLPPEQQILAKYGELQKTAIQIGKELTDLRDTKKTPEAQRTSTQQQRIAQLVKIQADIDQQFNQFIDSRDVQALVDQLSRTARKQSLDLESLSALKDDLRKAGNAVLLYPLILEDRLELILTTPDSPPIRRTVAVKREELNRTIVEFRSALKNPASDAKVPAQKLYNWLIKPLEADLKQSGSQTIIYAPDGQLRYIPLSALFDGKQWLVERYRINNITAKSLTNLNIKAPTKPKVLAGAFGSGRYSFTVGQTPFTFNGLLGAQKEVQLLTASLPGTTTLIDSKFSRDATTTKMNEYAIVHLATHAAFVTGDPSNSFVLFGNGDRASLVDIRNWDLTNVDLIVLSACETGLGGQFGNGEEVLGLGYVFQEKGARAVLASLWTVDDGGTQVLMNAFYEQLKSGNVAKVEALRQAQIALINANNKTVSNGKRSSIEIEALNSGVTPNTVNRLNHPYYWAPFILIGNGL
jgi:CHAT domain-containing protein